MPSGDLSDDAATRARLAAIVESSDDAIIGKDLDSIITSWNPGAERLFGYSAAEIIGQPIDLLISPDRPDEESSIIRRLRRGERIDHYETIRMRKDGTPVDVSVSISPIRDGQGQVVGAASIARDITDRRRIEREREELLARERAARERAERAVDRTTRLQHVTEALARALTVSEVGQAVIDRGLPGLGAAAGSVGVLDDDGATLELVATLGYPASLVDDLRRLPLADATPLAEAVRTGRLVWRRAGSADSARFSDFTRLASGFPAGAAVPLTYDGIVLGGIGLSFAEPRDFDDEDRGFLLTLAGQCAQAIQRVRLYEQERSARDQLDAILRGVADGVLVQREDGTVFFANDAAARMAGFSSADAYLGTTPFEVARRLTVLDAAGQPFPYDRLPARRAFRGEPAPEMVVQFRRADSAELRWSRTQSRIIRGADGAPLAISIFRDITDEVRSQERLRFLAEAGAQLAGAFDIDETLDGLVEVAASTLADWAVVILIDEDGAVHHIASAHRDPERGALARQLHERQLKHASGAALLWQAIQTGEPLLAPEVTDEMIVRSARNEEHLHLLRALGLTSLLYAPLVGRGRVQGAIALFMAQSGRRFGEEDRAIAVEMARRVSLTLENARLYRETREAVRARDEFLSIASHELRTPITGISGVAQMALRSKQRGTLDDARLTRALEQIMRSSQRLVTLTEDLLDVSRLQTGRFELRAEDVDLRAFIADLTERFGADLGERHRIVYAAAADTTAAGGEAAGGEAAGGEAAGGQLVIRADPARLEQVLANLLSNAVKYTPDGGPIVVTARRHDGGALVTVRDPGIGLPPGSEEAIFQPFGRAPNATHRHIQGLGLGLYICRQIVERHGGRIWAESPGDGLGTTMHLWLP